MSKELIDKAMKEPKRADPSYIGPFVAYLASDAAGNINGCMFAISGHELGIWGDPEIVRHVPRDWEKEGRWRFEDIEKLVPEKLLVGYVNPAPPQAEAE